MENGHLVSVFRQISVFLDSVPNRKYEMTASPNVKVFSQRENIPEGSVF